MVQLEWKVKSADDLAQADAVQQLPAGCCPYVGAPQFNGASIRKCKVSSTTACTPTEFTTPAIFDKCLSKREHDTYLQDISETTQIARRQV